MAEQKAEALAPGEIIRAEEGADRKFQITVDGRVYHHVRDAADGRWIYAPWRECDKA